MQLYCIRFNRTYFDGDSTEHKFFLYDKTKLDAVKRFCTITGYKRDCIISVHVVSQRKKENKTNGIDG